MQTCTVINKEKDILEISLTNEAIDKVCALLPHSVQTFPLIRLFPVSYTHLDVYKRQQLQCIIYELYVFQIVNKVKETLIR